MSVLAEGHRTIVDVLARYGREQPDHVCCQIYRGDGPAIRVTYGDVVEHGLRYAALYQQRGAQPGDIITIVLRTGEDLVYAFLGGILGGFIPSYAAPLGDRQEPVHYWDQLRLQLHRSEDGFLLVEHEFAETLAHMGMEAVAGRVITPDELASVQNRAPIRWPAPKDVAFLQHSSGTTGARKGVALSHQSVIEQTRCYATALNLCAADVVVSWLPLYHDMGLISSFLLPLLTGTPLVLIDPFEWVAAPWLLLDRISRHAGTLVWLPNFSFHLLARTGVPASIPLDLSSVRAFINCSEPCKIEAFNTFLDRFRDFGVDRGALHVCYAMAETVFAVTQTQLDTMVEPKRVSRRALLGDTLRPAMTEDDVMLIMPVGKPLNGVRIKIADAEGNDLPDGAVGEVLISADHMFSGYYQEPELTAAALADGFYRSGDLGGFLDGNLYITGRKKDVIIVNGKNFYAHDIEAVVNTVDSVKSGRCVAFGLPNVAMGSETVCVLAESEAAAAEHAGIARAIKEAVRGYLGLVVGKVAIVAPRRLIKTTSGKISRKENMERFVSGRI